MAGMGPSSTADGQTFNQCPYCGLYHKGNCPKIKSIIYHPNGTVKKIVFRPSM